MPQLISKGVVATALAGHMLTPGLAQGMKIPGETATQSNIVKPAPLEATAERIAEPAELATAYVMLADPLSSYISGATIAMPGGKPIL